MKPSKYIHSLQRVKKRGAHVMRSEKSTPHKSLLQAIGKSFYDSIGDIVFGMEDGTVSIFGTPARTFGTEEPVRTGYMDVHLRYSTTPCRDTAYRAEASSHSPRCFGSQRWEIESMQTHFTV
jgi:hypothetical protein